MFLSIIILYIDLQFFVKKLFLYFLMNIILGRCKINISSKHIEDYFNLSVIFSLKEFEVNIIWDSFYSIFYNFNIRSYIIIKCIGLPILIKNIIFSFALKTYKNKYSKSKK
jgi:hypothetical protein